VTSLENRHGYEEKIIRDWRIPFRYNLRHDRFGRVCSYYRSSLMTKRKKESSIVTALARLVNVLTAACIVAVFGGYQLVTSDNAKGTLANPKKNLEEPVKIEPSALQTAPVVSCEGVDQAGINFNRIGIQGADKVDLECLKAQALTGSSRSIDRLDDLNRCDQHVNYVKLGGVKSCMKFLGYNVSDPQLATAIEVTEANHIPAKIPYCDRPSHDRKVKRTVQKMVKFARLCWTK
jgi:hypothetical protein